MSSTDESVYERLRKSIAQLDEKLREGHGADRDVHPRILAERTKRIAKAPVQVDLLVAGALSPSSICRFSLRRMFPRRMNPSIWSWPRTRRSSAVSPRTFCTTSSKSIGARWRRRCPRSHHSCNATPSACSKIAPSFSTSYRCCPTAPCASRSVADASRRCGIRSALRDVAQ